MTSLLYKFFLLMLLRSKPQDIEYSPLAAIYTSFAYVLTGVLVLSSTVAPAHVIQGMILGLVVHLLFTWMLLLMLERKPRFIQAITALMGVSMMFNLLAWPLLAGLEASSNGDALQQLVSFLYIMLLSWEVMAKAHIYRHALETEMVSALLLSLCLLFVGFALANILLPQPA